MPVTRALRDHVKGIDRTSDGHSLPVQWASSAYFMWWFLGTILGKRICCFLYFVDYNFVFLYNALWWFDDTSIEIMILLWYIFVNIFESVILQSVMYQQFICKQWYFETFLKEKTFMCEYKGMGESASFVSGSSHHFPEKYRKLEKTLESLSVSFLFCYICIRKYQYVEDKGWYNG